MFAGNDNRFIRQFIRMFGIRLKLLHISVKTFF